MKIGFLLPVTGKLLTLLTKKHKVVLGVLIIATIGLSLIETAGISAIMPFISVASNPSLLDSGMYKKVFDFFNFTEKNIFIIYFGIAIIVFYLFRAVYSAFHTYSINRCAAAVNKYFAKRLFNTFLHIPYKLYVQKNSGVIMQIVNSESQNISNLALNMLQLCSELFTICLVYALMVIINWQMTLILTVVLSALVFCFLQILVSKNRVLGVRRVENSRKMYRTLVEAFGNFKYVRLKGNEDSILDTHSHVLAEAAKTQVASGTLAIVPKSVLESLGFSLLIAAVIFILWRFHDASQVIPVISMYALALYRILPALNRMLGNINSIAYIQRSLDVVDENLHLPVEKEGSEPVAFEKSIRLENISFEYQDSQEVLSDISLEIRKGDKLAVTGESGGGKSTLVDLIIGIHKPSKGAVYIDGEPLSGDNVRAWRSRIGYIPQSIYLFDGTVAENISLGSESDDAKIIEVLKKANIWEFLATREGIHTRVGEGGIQLSGGQQQRIGIARALYNDPDVLVLDEATSALDTETEEKIMEEIYDAGKNKTLIIIAHRLSTVERCERRIQIENGRIVS